MPLLALSPCRWALAILCACPAVASGQLFSLCDRGSGPVSVERLVATNPPPLWAKSGATNPHLAALLKGEMTPEEVERLRQQGRSGGIGCGAGYTRISYCYVFSPYHPRVCISFHYRDSDLYMFAGPDFLYTREGDLFVAHSIPDYWNRRPADRYESIR